MSWRPNTAAPRIPAAVLRKGAVPAALLAALTGPLAWSTLERWEGNILRVYADHLAGGIPTYCAGRTDWQAPVGTRVHCRTGSSESPTQTSTHGSEVHCRTGSSEMTMPERTERHGVHCRTGSSETDLPATAATGSVHCRTGSSESVPLEPSAG